MRNLAQFFGMVIISTFIACNNDDGQNVSGKIIFIENITFKGDRTELFYNGNGQVSEVNS